MILLTCLEHVEEKVLNIQSWSLLEFQSLESQLFEWLICFGDPYCQLQINIQGKEEKLEVHDIAGPSVTGTPVGSSTDISFLR